MSAAPAHSGDARLWLPAVPPAPSFHLSPSWPRGPRCSASLPPPSDVITFRIPSVGPPPALHAKPPSLQVFETHFLSALQFLFLCERVLPPPCQDGFPPAVFSGSVSRQVASTFFSSLAPVADRSAPAVSPSTVSETPASPAVCLEPFSVAIWEKHLPALRAHAETSLPARCSLVLAVAFATLTCEKPREISSFVSILSGLLDPESDSGRGIVLKQEARRWLSAVGVETQTAGVSSRLSRVRRSTSTDPFVSFFAGFLSSALTSLLRTAPGVLPFYRSRITTNHLPLLLSLDRGGHWVSLLLTLLRYVYTLLLHPPTAVEASAAAVREAASPSGARLEEARPAEGPSSGAMGSNAGAESRDISPTTHALTVLRFLRQQLDAVCGQPALAALSFFLCSRLLASATAGGSLQLVGREAEAVVCGVWGRREGRAAVCLLGGREVVRVMGELARLAAIRRSVWPSLLHAPDEHLLPLLVSRLGRRPLGATGARGNAGTAWREKRAREAVLAGAGPRGAQRSPSMDRAPGEEGDKRDCEEEPAASRESWGGVWEAGPSLSEKRTPAPCRNCASLCWRHALGLLSRSARNRSGPRPLSVACSRSSALNVSATETARRLRSGEARVSLSRSRGESVDSNADLSAVSGTVSMERKRPHESSLPRGGEEATGPRLAAKRVRGEVLGPFACTAERGGETSEGEKESIEQGRGGDVSPPQVSGVPRGGEHTPADRGDSKLNRESFRTERPPHSGLCEACCRCLRKTRSELRKTKKSDADGPRHRPRNPVSLPWLFGEQDAVDGSPEPSSHALAVAETARDAAPTSLHPRASLLAWLLCLPPSFVLMSLLLPPGLVRDLLFLLSQMQLLAPAPDGVASELEPLGAPASRAVKKHVARRFLAQAAGASQQFFFEAFQHHWLLPPSVANPLAAAAASGASGPLPQAFAMLAPFVGDLARFVVLLTPRFASVATIPEHTRGVGAPGPGSAVSGRGWKPVGETEAGQRGEEGKLEKGAAPRGLQLCHLRLSSPSVVFARWLLSSVHLNIPFPFSVVAAAHARLAFCLDWLCFLPPRLLPSSSRSAAVSPGAPAFHSLQEPQPTLLGNRVSLAAHAFDFAVWRTPAACLQAAERTENLLRIAVEHSRGTSARARAAASAAASATAIAQQESRLLSAELRSRTLNGATDPWVGPGAPATQGPSGFFCEDTGRRERLAAAREAAKETVRRATAAGLPTVWASGAFPTRFLQEAVVLPLLQFLLPCRRQSAAGRACTQGSEMRRKKGVARGASEVSPQGAASGLGHGLEGEKSPSTGHLDRMQDPAAGGQAERGQGVNREAEERREREDSRDQLFPSLEERAGAVYGLPGNLSQDAGAARLARLLPFGFLAFQLATDAAVLPRDAASLLDFFGCLLASYSPSSLPLFLPSLATALASFGLLQLFLLPASPLAVSLGKGRPPSAALTAAIQSHTLPGLLLRQAGFPVRLAYRSVGPPRGDSSASAFGRVSGAQTVSGGTGGPASLGADLAPDRLGPAPQESPSPSDEEASSRESSQGRPEGLRGTRVFLENPGPPAGRPRELSASEGAWRPVLYLGGSGAQSDFKSLVPLHQLLLHACVAAVAMVAQVASGAPAFRVLGEICWRSARAPHRDTLGAPAGSLHAANPEGKVGESRPFKATGGVSSGGEAETLEEEREAEEPGEDVLGEKESAVESEDSQPFSSSGCSSDSETDSSAFSQDEDDEALSDIFFRPAQDRALAVFLSRRASTPRPSPSGSRPSVSSVSSGPRSASDPRPQRSACGSNRAGAGGAEGEKKENSETTMHGGSFYQLPAFLEFQSGLATEGGVFRNVGAPGRPEKRRPRRALKPKSSLALLAVEATEPGHPCGLMAAFQRREKAEEETCFGRCLCRPSRWWRVLLRPAENGKVSPFPSQRKASISFSPSVLSLLAALIRRETPQEAELEASRAAKQTETTEERKDTERRRGEQSVGMKEGGEAGAADGGERSSVASAERANERASDVWHLVACVRQALESACRGAFEDLKRSSEQPSGTACAVQRAALQQDARDETRQDKPLSYIARLLLERVSKVSPVSEETLCGTPSRGAKDLSAGVYCLQFSSLRGRGPSSEGDAHELSQRLCLLLSAVGRDLWRAREGPISECLFCGLLLGSKGAAAREGRRGSREGNAGEAEQRRVLENVESEETEGKEEKRRETQKRSKAQCRGILGRTGDSEDAFESSCCWGASPKQETMYKDALFLWGSLLAEMQRLQEETRGRGNLEGAEQKGEVQEDTIETQDAPDSCPFVGFLLLCLLAQSAEAAAKVATVDSGRLQFCRVKTQKDEVEEEPDHCAGGNEAGAGGTTRESEEDRRSREHLHETASLLRVCLHLYGVYIHRRMCDLGVSNPRKVVTRDLELGLPFLFFAQSQLGRRARHQTSQGPSLLKAEAEAWVQAEDNGLLPTPFALLCQCYHLPAHMLPLFIGQVPLLSAVFVSSSVGELETLGARCGLLQSVSEDRGEAPGVATPPGKGSLLPRPSSRPFCCGLCACMRAGERDTRKEERRVQRGEEPTLPARTYPLFTLPDWHEQFLERRKRRRGEENRDTGAGFHWCKSREVVKLVQRVLLPRTLFPPSVLQWRSFLLAWRLFGREMEIYHLLDVPTPSFLSRPVFPLSSSDLAASASVGSESLTDLSNGSSLPGSGLLGSPISSERDSSPEVKPWPLHERRNALSGALPLWPCAKADGEDQSDGGERLVLHEEKSGECFFTRETRPKGIGGRLSSFSSPLFSSDPRQGSVSSLHASLVLLPPFAIPASVALCLPPSPLLLDLLDALLSLLSLSFSASSHSTPVASLHPQGSQVLLGCLMALLPLVSSLRPSFPVLRQTLWTLASASGPRGAGESPQLREERSEDAVALLVTWLLTWHAADPARLKCMVALLKVQPLPRLPPQQESHPSNGERGGDRKKTSAREDRRSAGGETRARRGVEDSAKHRPSAEIRQRERRDERQRNENGGREEEREEERVKEVWNAEDQGHGVWQRATVQIAAFATRHAGPSSRDPSVLVVRLNLLRLFSFPERNSEKVAANVKVSEDSLHGGKEDGCAEIPMADIQRFCEFLVSPGPSMPSSPSPER